MSQVVSTILLILLILIAIGGIWAALNQFIFSETSKISLTKLTTDVKIKNVAINATSGIADIRVMRDIGEGNITAIKFIVKDTKTSEVFEVPVEDFVELSERTISLNFSESELLNISDVYEISIAPVYLSPTTGNSQIGRITDSVGDLFIYVNGTTSTGGGSSPDGTFCSIPSDCGTDAWVNATQLCSEDTTKVLQYKKVFSCTLSFCTSTTDQYTKESCVEGDYCFNGECINHPIPCTNATVELDCGTAGFIGQLRCASSSPPHVTVQDYRNYSCVNNLCQETTYEQTVETCISGDECFNGECFTPVECIQYEDCDLGKICEGGLCVTELFSNNGTIRSVWPYGIGEYFDSFELPSDNTSNFDATNNYIIFPYSSETRCLQVKEFTKPGFVGGISYIRLNETPTNISDNDVYQLWETDYACSLI